MGIRPDNFLCGFFWESSRGKTIRGNRTENPEREICLWEGLWEDLWKPQKKTQKTSESLWKTLKTSEKPLKPCLSETLSEAGLPLRGSRSCCPYSFCPLNSLRLFFCPWSGSCFQNMLREDPFWPPPCPSFLWSFFGAGKRGHYEKVFSPEESLESLKSLDSLESLEIGRILLSFPQSGGSLEYLKSLNSLESLENELFWKDPFSKRPLFPNPIFDRVNTWCIVFFCPEAPSLVAHNQGAWVGFIKCLAARNLILKFPLFQWDFQRENLWI